MIYKTGGYRPDDDDCDPTSKLITSPFHKEEGRYNGAVRSALPRPVNYLKNEVISSYDDY